MKKLENLKFTSLAPAKVLLRGEALEVQIAGNALLYAPASENIGAIYPGIPLSPFPRIRFLQTCVLVSVRLLRLNPKSSRVPELVADLRDTLHLLASQSGTQSVVWRVGYLALKRFGLTFDEQSLLAFIRSDYLPTGSPKTAGEAWITLETTLESVWRKPFLSLEYVGAVYRDRQEEVVVCATLTSHSGMVLTVVKEVR